MRHQQSSLIRDHLIKNALDIKNCGVYSSSRTVASIAHQAALAAIPQAIRKKLRFDEMHLCAIPLKGISISLCSGFVRNDHKLKLLLASSENDI
mmetsp:Transcript_50614/g.60877  ORF Transcript_50614/g.60877 Transcript_50614/m.60877 type:complete len:94 (+) Transcript_50614:69-350(+)